MNTDLPPAEKSRVQLGYVRLTDSAPLIVARELGLFERYGLDVTLSQEVSWANVRDKLAVRALDAAQMLAPLPAMTTLGVSGIRVPMLSGLTLSLNGNAITVSRDLWQAMANRCGDHPDEKSTAAALHALIRSRGPDHKLTLAVVHAFSTHTLLLRTWLRAGGIDPDLDVRTIVVPPAQMLDSLAGGIIDGYCVGEPWNSMAAHDGTGAIAAVGARIWNNAPEKVFCVTQDWHQRHPATHLRLRLALMEAAAWLTDPGHRAAAARLIGAPEYLNLPAERLLPSLTGRIGIGCGDTHEVLEDFQVFNTRLAGFPWRSHTEFLITRCSELLGRPLHADQIRSLAQQTTRPDLFRDCARVLGITAPRIDYLPHHQSNALQDVEPGVEVRGNRLLA